MVSEMLNYSHNSQSCECWVFSAVELINVLGFLDRVLTGLSILLLLPQINTNTNHHDGNTTTEHL
jgi:hypothetical protein